MRAAALLAAGFLMGAAFAMNAAAGTALLLYTGHGFLRAAGLLIAFAIGSLAAGLWAAGDTHATRLRRWVAALLFYSVAALAVLAWSARPELQARAGAAAVTMLFALALPAYTTGVLIAGLDSPAHGTGVAGLAGAAVAVLASTALLIPRLDAPIVFALAAGLVLVAFLLDPERFPSSGDPMGTRVALISGVGAPGQLAHTIAQRFLRSGYAVVITGRTDAVNEIAESLRDERGEVISVAADLLQDGACELVVRTAMQRLGRLDVLVNAAGGLSLIRSVVETTRDELQRELDRNLGTALLLSRAALPALRQTSGCIINFASPAARNAPARLAAYSAAKAGVVALTQSLASEERAHGVRVNAVAPGVMDTLQNRAADAQRRRWVPMQAVADVVLFLASPEASALSGEVIQVLGEREVPANA